METAWHIWHVINFTAIVSLIAFIFQQHKSIIKLKDRMNKMWFQYCKEHKIPYDSIDDDRAYFFNHDEIKTAE